MWWLEHFKSRPQLTSCFHWTGQPNDTPRGRCWWPQLLLLLLGVKATAFSHQTTCQVCVTPGLSETLSPTPGMAARKLEWARLSSFSLPRTDSNGGSWVQAAREGAGSPVGSDPSTLAVGLTPAPFHAPIRRVTHDYRLQPFDICSCSVVRAEVRMINALVMGTE